MLVHAAHQRSACICGEPDSYTAYAVLRSMSSVIGLLVSALANTFLFDLPFSSPMVSAAEPILHTSMARPI